jgi:hypothetical protein
MSLMRLVRTHEEDRTPPAFAIPWKRASLMVMTISDPWRARVRCCSNVRSWAKGELGCHMDHVAQWTQERRPATFAGGQSAHSATMW